MKVFLLYDKANEFAQNCANEVDTLIKRGGFEVVYGNGADEKPDLTEARFLILIADTTNDFSNPSITSKWRFFLNEIRWKRKIMGDIILICSDNCDLNRVPFTLRDCKILTQSELNKLNKLMLSFKEDNSPNDYSHENRTREHLHKAEHNPTNISQSRTAAPIETNKTYVDNGCKKDHVFERNEKSSALERKSTISTQKSTISTQKSTTSAQKPIENTPKSAPKPTPTATKQNQQSTKTVERPTNTPQNQQSQRPIERPTNTPQGQQSRDERPNYSAPQNKPVNINKNDADDDYDPFKPHQKKNIKQQGLAGCIIGGFFIFFFFLIIMILNNLN